MHVPHYSHHYTAYVNTLKGRLVASLSIRDFVSSMTNVFIPVYLYSFGYSVLFIATFYAVYFVLGFFTYQLVAWVIARHGLYHSLFISYIALAVASGLLSLAGHSFVFVFLALIPLLASEKFFWPARHIDIARLFSSGKNMKKTTSSLNTLSMFIQAIAPLLGGLLASQYGAGAALFCAFIIMLFAIGLLWGEYEKERGEVVTSTFNLIFKRSMIGNAAMNIQSITSALLWPLFIFLFVTSFDSLGMVLSIGFGFSMLLTYASGNWFGKFPYFKLGLAVRTLSFPLRIFVASVAGFFGVDMLGNLGNSFMASRYNARYYNEAHASKDIDSYVLSMESGGELGKIILAFLLLGLLLFGTSVKTALVACFIFAALITPFSALLGSKELE
jgi:MFS family permease